MIDLKTTTDLCKYTRYIPTYSDNYVSYVYDEAERKREKVRKLNRYIADKWRKEPGCQCSMCNTAVK